MNPQAQSVRPTSARLAAPFELRHLRYFLAVAEELNFTRAARRLNVVQQTLSEGIAQLEEMLGLRLFDRATRPVALTDAAAQWLPYALRAAARGCGGSVVSEQRLPARRVGKHPARRDEVPDTLHVRGQ